MNEVSNEQLVNNQNVGNQVPNQPSNNNKSSNGLMVVIIILLLALIGVVVYAFILKSTDKNESSNNNTENNTIQQPQNNETKQNVNNDNNSTKKDEVTVNLADYKKVYDEFITYGLFYKVDEFDGKLADEKLTYNTISNSYFLDLAIRELVDNKKMIEGDYDLKDDHMYYAKVSSTDVDNKIKELFGNIKYNNQSTYFYKYNSNDGYYYIPGIGGTTTFDNKEQAVSVPIKVTTSGDMLYIYGVVGVLDFKNTKMYTSLNKSKEMSVKIKDCALDVASACTFDGKEIEEYMKTNQNNFSQYKYSFKKVGTNYQFINIEKIS